MAKQKTEPKTIKKCPKCGATKFRLHTKGQIINGKFVADSHDYECLGHHETFDGMDQLVDDRIS